MSEWVLGPEWAHNLCFGRDLGRGEWSGGMEQGIRGGIRSATPRHKSRRKPKGSRDERAFWRLERTGAGGARDARCLWSRVRRWRCRHPLPSEPDVRLSPHPAQAISKPCVSRASVHNGLVPASPRWMPNRLRKARSSKYRRQRGSNGLAVPLICGCRRILVSVACRNLNQTIWSLGVRSPVSTANTQLR